MTTPTEPTTERAIQQFDPLATMVGDFVRNFVAPERRVDAIDRLYILLDEARAAASLDVETLMHISLSTDCLDSMGNAGWCATHDRAYPEPSIYCEGYWEAFAAEYARLTAEGEQK